MCYGSVCVCYLSRVWLLFLNAQCCAAVSNGHLQLFACCFSWFWAMYNMWYLSSAMRSASWPWCDLVASFSVHCSETVSALLVIFVTFCADFIKTFSLNQKLLQSRSGLPELTNSRNVTTAERCVHLPPRCWPNCSRDRLFQACFPIFSTVCLELAATNSSH